MKDKKPLLVIAAGGTGGHMFPAQALAEEMLRRGWRVQLATDPRGMRYAGGFAPAVERVELSSASFSQGGKLARLKAPFRILSGIREAIRRFRADPPACVAGFGGYPALPSLAAAWWLDLPRLIHEQNGVLGRVNRLFAARVHKVACGTWPVTNPPKGASLTHIGNPIRDSVRDQLEVPYFPPPDIATPGEAIALTVFGGSQGASVFSKLVPEAIALLPEALRRRLIVVQQVRPGDEDAVKAAYEAAGVQHRLAPFFDDMPALLAGSQLVICRSGASSVAELSALGRPSILVPYPAAMDDHQTANAMALVTAGGAILAQERETTTDSLARHVEAVLTNPEQATQMAGHARALGRPDAARDLADMVEALGVESLGKKAPA